MRGERHGFDHPRIERRKREPVDRDEFVDHTFIILSSTNIDKFVIIVYSLKIFAFASSAGEWMAKSIVAANDNRPQWSHQELNITERQAERLRQREPVVHWTASLAERTERSLEERGMLAWARFGGGKHYVVANTKGRAALELFDSRRRNRTRGRA